jgi:hypothetical protein
MGALKAPSNARLITSLAMLQVTADKGHKTYADNFVPFVAECCRTAAQSAISLPEVRDAVQLRFGISMPLGALAVVLRRAVSNGYLTVRNGIYVRNEDALAELDFARIRDEAAREHEALLDRFVAYSDEVLSVKLTREQAEAALDSYFREKATLVLALSVGLGPENRLKEDKHRDFIVKSFVIHLHERDPEGFRFLETVIRGSVLADVLLYPDLDDVERRFVDTNIYFDTPFLIRTLGLVGPEYEAPGRELLMLLETNGAILRCFRHSMFEVKGVLHGTAEDLSSDGGALGGPLSTTRYFREKGYGPSEAIRLRNGLEKMLGDLHVGVVDAPPYSDTAWVNEEELASKLMNAVGYRQTDTRDRDSESISAIYRLRGGEYPDRLESCKAIFVTTNTGVVAASASFYAAQGNQSRAAIPLCVLDYPLTVLAWLKTPLKAPDLPRKAVIADCYAALNPPEKLWKSYVSRVDELASNDEISSDEYHVLRDSLEARRTLMQVTHGDPDAFVEGSTREIFERALENVRAEDRTKLAKTTLELDRVKAELGAAEVDKVRVRGAKTRDDDERRSNVRNFSTRWAHRLTNALYALIAVLLFLGFYVTLPAVFPDWMQGPAKHLPSVVVSLLAVLVLAFTFAGLLHGTSLKSVMRRFEGVIAKYIERSLCKSLKL